MFKKTRKKIKRVERKRYIRKKTGIDLRPATDLLGKIGRLPKTSIRWGAERLASADPNEHGVNVSRLLTSGMERGVDAVLDRLADAQRNRASEIFFRFQDIVDDAAAKSIHSVQKKIASRAALDKGVLIANRRRVPGRKGISEELSEFSELGKSLKRRSRKITSRKEKNIKELASNSATASAMMRLINEMDDEYKRNKRR